MVSKYRDILEPPVCVRAPSPIQHVRNDNSSHHSESPQGEILLSGKIILNLFESKSQMCLEAHYFYTASSQQLIPLALRSAHLHLL